MKTLLATLSLLIIASASAFAWEYPDNPDRFPSIGINYTGSAETGKFKTMGVDQDLTGNSSLLILDTRLPLSNQFTLTVGIGGTASTTKGDSNLFFASDQTDSSGGVFTIGGRYYFNGK